MPGEGRGRLGADFFSVLVWEGFLAAGLFRGGEGLPKCWGRWS